jgi:predicted HicB family RNase H-like nuclease
VAADFGLERPFQRAEFGTFNVYAVNVAERLSATANRRGVSLSALIASVLTEFAETD